MSTFAASVHVCTNAQRWSLQIAFACLNMFERTSGAVLLHGSDIMPSAHLMHATASPPCFEQVAQLNVPYILMHMRGTPETMQQMTHYNDICLEVGHELQAQAEAAIQAGIQPWRIILDPGAALCGVRAVTLYAQSLFLQVATPCVMLACNALTQHQSFCTLVRCAKL